MKTRVSSFVAAMIALLAPWSARADTIGFSTTGGSLTTGGPATFGYTFSLSTPIQLTQLGFYDYQADGLSAAVPVTVWNSAGQAVVSLTLPSNVSAGETNQYLYGKLNSGVLLTVGTYTIGAYVTSGSDEFQNGVTATAAAEITYGQSRYISGNRYPTVNFPGFGTAYFGPNFQFTAVPEPSTWAMLGVGAVGAGVVALRRRQALRG